MALPEIVIEIAFATLPLAATPTYTDVSAYVLSIPSIRRGRSFELARMEAGTATVVLDNSDRRFDPTYTSGPYYPNVVPMRKIRISAIWSGTTYRLFTGYIKEWPPEWDGLDSTVTVSCVDGFTYFARALLTLTVPSAPSGVQIKATVGVYGFDGILINLSWPNADQDVNTGASTMQGWTMTNETVLQRFQTIVDSENGFLWMGADGKLWYRERHWRLTSAVRTNSTGGAGGSSVSQGSFGDVSPELPYTDLRPVYDDTLIYSDIHVTRAGGTEQVAQDTTSQGAYFKRSLIKTGLLITTDNEANDAAYWLLGQYKDAALRFAAMTVDGHSDDLLWPHMLGRDFNDRITVTKRPPGGAGTMTSDCFIEAIEHHIEPGIYRWNTTWQLSPALSSSYWVLGDAVLSILDSTTRLVY